jgi:hypothetical protein
MFIATVIGIYQALRVIGKQMLDRDLSIDALRSLQRPAAYAVGILASFWMVERVASFWI